MKNLYLILLSLMFSELAQAETYAVEICDKLNRVAFEAQCKEANISYLFMKNEGVFLIETDNLASLNISCFISLVRTHQNHLAFNTSTLMLKLSRNASVDFLEKYPLTPHDFVPDLYYLETGLKQDRDLMELQQELEAFSFIRIVAIKQVFTLQAATNDPLYNRQWSIENTGISLQSNGTPGADMSVDSAWTLSQGNAAIKIAILDSGVDTLHEDLINNILVGFDAFHTDTTDTKGYPTPNFSSDGHGTACAGIVAAESDNSIGIAGIANQCKIVPIRIFYYQDYGGSVGVQATTNRDALVSGSAYAWRVANVDVMSTSAGLSPLFIGVLFINTQLVSEEINEAFLGGRNGYGVPMFFSAGNDDFNDVLWPADMPNTIAIGASSMCDERKNPNDCSPENWGSSYGVTLDVIAPGVRITTTDMMGSNGFTNTPYTTTFNGTSAACPNAAGVGALILALSPGLHARDVKAILNITADRVSNYVYDSTTIHGTWNEEVGHGRVNAFEALKLSLSYQTSVGIQEVKQALSFNIFPNPSKGSLFIHSEFDADKELILFNLLGEELLRIQLNPGTQRLDVNLDSGVYFVSIPELGLTKQFIKH